MTTPNNHHRVIEAREIEIPVGAPPTGLTMQDIASVGGLLVANGLSRLQAQAFVARVQHICAQAALAASSELLEEIRKVNEARMASAKIQIRTLPQNFGWVNRDRVLQILEHIDATTPRP